MDAQSQVEESILNKVEIKVDPGQSPIRIDKYLVDRMLNVTRNRLQNSIKAGAVTVNGKLVKPNYKVNPNDEILVILPRPAKWSEGVIPQDIPLDIRYEDDHLMVVHKPAGLVVHPGIGNADGTLVNALAHYFEGQQLPVNEGNGVDRMGLVHRLDKNTSGLLVVGKTEFALSHLAKQFFDHSIEREYVALVWGEPDEQKGTVEGYIGRNPTNRMQYTTVESEIDGKWAVTHWEKILGMYYVTLIKCRLETGRTHQIRVHLKSLGHPIFSDERYGGDRIVKGTVFNKYKYFVENAFKLCDRQALHARLLSFTHPETGERMSFEADLPADMAAVLDKWEKYVHTRKENI